MSNLPRLAFAAAAVLCARSAHAWHFETRFVERIGNVDVPLPGNTIDASDGNARNIRLQMGVFDDANGAAPAGGVLGWNNNGHLAVSGSASNSDERRNPGRLAPFTFSPGPQSNGLPALPDGDPFTNLDFIDATVILQNVGWACQPDGTPAPRPQPVIHGVNSFASIYAFSIDPNPGAVDYTVTASGRQYACDFWESEVFTVIPDCSDPDNPIDGVSSWSPEGVQQNEFITTLNVVVVPAPGAGAAALTALLALSARRRRSI